MNLSIALNYKYKASLYAQSEAFLYFFKKDVYKCDKTGIRLFNIITFLKTVYFLKK